MKRLISIICFILLFYQSVFAGEFYANLLCYEYSSDFGVSDGRVIIVSQIDTSKVDGRVLADKKSQGYIDNPVLNINDYVKSKISVFDYVPGKRKEDSVEEFASKVIEEQSPDFTISDVLMGRSMDDLVVAWNNNEDLILHYDDKPQESQIVSDKIDSTTVYCEPYIVEK